MRRSISCTPAQPCGAAAPGAGATVGAGVTVGAAVRMAPPVGAVALVALLPSVLPVMLAGSEATGVGVVTGVGVTGAVVVVDTVVAPTPPSVVVTAVPGVAGLIPPFSMIACA